MPRLFSAIRLPAVVRTHLSLLRGEIGSARWVQAENMHITLRFFGDVSDATADELAGLLEAFDAEPFFIEIVGTGTFGGQGETVIYATVKPEPALDALQRAQERMARACGLPAPEHAFKPHVTLARARHAKRSAVARFLEETGALRIAPFRVDEFALLSSRPGRGGGPYAEEVVVAFG